MCDYKLLLNEYDKTNLEVIKKAEEYLRKCYGKVQVTITNKDCLVFSTKPYYETICELITDLDDHLPELLLEAEEDADDLRLYKGGYLDDYFSYIHFYIHKKDDAYTNLNKQFVCLVEMILCGLDDYLVVKHGIPCC